MTTRTAWTICPYCLRHYDGATNIRDDDPDKVPSDGAVALCIDCTRLSVFDSTAPGGRRRPTAAEQAEIDADAEINRAVRAMRVANVLRAKRRY